MIARLVFSPRMQLQARRADAWWRENRTAAPDLFANELQRAVHLVALHPSVGKPMALPGLPDLRRIELKSTRYFLLYKHDPVANLVLPLTVWSALRGRGPRLPKP